MAMSPEQWDRVKDLYEQALECDTAQRADFLQRNTTDEVVRAEVRRLLAGHEHAGNFLSTLPLLDNRPTPQQPGKVFAPGQILAERFRIVSFIAAGGMGEVYEAEDLTLKENLAIKTIRPEVLQQNNALARFTREVQLARRVTHPNICRIFDLFWHTRTGSKEDSTVVFVSMELLRGETLLERIRRAGRFSAEEAKPLLDQIASGLEAAHRVGVVHRDLKPGNVILVPEQGENQVRGVITDFGLALRTGQDTHQSVDLSVTQGLLGTPAYMAPEQIEGKEVTKSVDIYALGLILYEMVTGEHAFPADTPLASAARRLSDPTVSPKRLAPELSDAWEQTIVRCLQREPNARYSSAIEVARALSLQTSTSASQQLSGHHQSGKLTRIALLWQRSKLALWIVSVMILSAIIGASVYGWRRQSGTRHQITQPLHKQITFLGNAGAPAISPDGTFIAYVTNATEGKQKLMMQGLTGDPGIELLEASGIAQPVWSPNGSELMVMMKAEGNSRADIGVFVVPRLGGTPRPVGTNLQGRCWLADGSHVVAANMNADPGIWLVNTKTGPEKRIPAPEYKWLFGLDCSAKTNLIVMLTQTSGTYQLWTMKLDGSDQRKLIDDKRKMDSPRLAATGDAIYYFREAGDTTDLVKLSLSGNSTASPVVLTSGLETGDTFTISADGSHLAYTRTQGFSNLWLEVVGGATARVREKPLTSGVLWHDYPSISPDGRWVAFVGGSNGTKANIYKMSMDGGEPAQLTFFDSSESASPAWSPDGRQIAFLCNQGGSFKVWLVSAAGGTARQFEKTNASDTNNGLSWFPSSDIVYQQPGLHNLRRLNIETQQDQPVLHEDSEGWLVTRPKFSPDGKTFAVLWNRLPSQGLWIVAPEKHQERLLSTNSYWALGWSPDGSSLYAGKFGGHEVVQIELNNSKETKTPIVVHGLLNGGSVSPDGKKIIVSVAEERSDVWVMENFDPQAAREKQSTR